MTLDLFCNDLTLPKIMHFLDNLSILRIALMWTFKMEIPCNPMRHSPRAMSLGNTPVKLQYFLAHIFEWGVLEHYRIRCHELPNVHGLTLVTLSLHGWEAFSTLGAITRTIITWVLLSMVP